MSEIALMMSELVKPRCDRFLKWRFSAAETFAEKGHWKLCRIIHDKIKALQSNADPLRYSDLTRLALSQERYDELKWIARAVPQGELTSDDLYALATFAVTSEEARIFFSLFEKLSDAEKLKFLRRRILQPDLVPRHDAGAYFLDTLLFQNRDNAKLVLESVSKEDSGEVITFAVKCLRLNCPVEILEKFVADSTVSDDLYIYYLKNDPGEKWTKELFQKILRQIGRNTLFLRVLPERIFPIDGRDFDLLQLLIDNSERLLVHFISIQKLVWSKDIALEALKAGKFKVLRFAIGQNLPYSPKDLLAAMDFHPRYKNRGVYADLYTQITDLKQLAMYWGPEDIKAFLESSSHSQSEFVVKNLVENEIKLPHDDLLAYVRKINRPFITNYLVSRKLLTLEEVAGLNGALSPQEYKELATKEESKIASYSFDLGAPSSVKLRPDDHLDIIDEEGYSRPVTTKAIKQALRNFKFGASEAEAPFVVDSASSASWVFSSKTSSTNEASVSSGDGAPLAFPSFSSPTSASAIPSNSFSMSSGGFGGFNSVEGSNPQSQTTSFFASFSPGAGSGFGELGANSGQSKGSPSFTSFTPSPDSGSGGFGGFGGFGVSIEQSKASPSFPTFSPTPPSGSGASFGGFGGFGGFGASSEPSQGLLDECFNDDSFFQEKEQ